MSGHEHHPDHDGPQGRVHQHGDHDHGPAIWRINRWLYPLLHRNPPSNRELVELADLQPDDRALDVGCGPGAAVRAAAPLVQESVGVDPSDRMLKMARRRSRDLSNVRYSQAPAHHLPFDDGAFTVVWTIHSMHHWGDERAGVAEARRVLAPGGRFFAMEVLDPGKPWGIDQAGVERIAEMMRGAGFADVDWKTHRIGKMNEVVIQGRV